jgi:hypothetical protein
MTEAEEKIADLIDNAEEFPDPKPELRVLREDLPATASFAICLLGRDRCSTGESR